MTWYYTRHFNIYSFPFLGENILPFSGQFFPETKELPGYFLGVANNIGDALTFVILSQDGSRLFRSVIRSALGKPLSGFPNARLQHVSYPVGAVPALPPSISDQDDGGVIISASQAPQPAELVHLDSETPSPDSNPDVVDDLPDLLDESNPKSPNTEVVETLNTEMETSPPPADISNTSEKNLVDSDNKRKFERTGIGTEPPKRVTFSDEKIPIDKSLSHKRSKVTKSSKKKTFTGPLRRSTRNSCQNLVKIGSFDWPELLAFFLAMGSVVFNSTPVLPDCFSNISKSIHDKIAKVMESQIEELPDLDDNSPSMRTLRYYHQLLDNAREAADPEDHFQDYVWKVDKIISRKRHGRQIFLHVQWRMGNRTWISLKSLRSHDPYICVTYAVEKHLINNPDWNWTRDFIDDTKRFTCLINAVKTTKTVS